MNTDQKYDAQASDATASPLIEQPAEQSPLRTPPPDNKQEHYNGSLTNGRSTAHLVFDALLDQRAQLTEAALSGNSDESAEAFRSEIYHLDELLQELSDQVFDQLKDLTSRY